MLCLFLFDSTYPLADVIMLIPSAVLETHGMHLMHEKSFVCFFWEVLEGAEMFQIGKRAVHIKRLKMGGRKKSRLKKVLYM